MARCPINFSLSFAANDKLKFTGRESGSSLFVSNYDRRLMGSVKVVNGQLAASTVSDHNLRYVSVVISGAFVLSSTEVGTA